MKHVENINYAKSRTCLCQAGITNIITTTDKFIQHDNINDIMTQLKTKRRQISYIKSGGKFNLNTMEKQQAE